jgi:hypothetical protein
VRRPTPYLRRRLIRLARAHEWRRTRRRVANAARNVRTAGRHTDVGGVRLVAPREFKLLYGNARVVCRFLSQIAKAVLDDGQDVTLDFRSTEMFYPDATILMFAEIDRIVTLSGRVKPITILNPIRRRPTEVLKQIGLHDLTTDICKVVPERDDVVYWKATKGDDGSGDKVSLLESVADRVRTDYSGQLRPDVLWRGVTEAVGNSVEHAYKKPRKDGFVGLSGTKWWMFTQVRDGKLSVAVCDLGCGYRETIGLTIPEIVRTELFAMFAGENKDAAAVKIAMEYGRTGTGASQRGRGSRDAMSVLERHGSGEMGILSNGGYVCYRKSPGEPLREFRSGSLGTSLGATVVWWQLPFEVSQ